MFQISILNMPLQWCHTNVIACQIAVNSTVCLIICFSWYQQKHQSMYYELFVRGIHQSLVVSHTKRDSNTESTSMSWYHHAFESYQCKITDAYLRGQWVNKSSEQFSMYRVKQSRWDHHRKLLLWSWSESSSKLTTMIAVKPDSLGCLAWRSRHWKIWLGTMSVK